MGPYNYVSMANKIWYEREVILFHTRRKAVITRGWTHILHLVFFFSLFYETQWDIFVQWNLLWFPITNISKPSLIQVHSGAPHNDLSAFAYIWSHCLHNGGGRGKQRAVKRAICSLSCWFGILAAIFSEHLVKSVASISHKRLDLVSDHSE